MDYMDDKGDGLIIIFGSLSKDDNDVDENFSWRYEFMYISWLLFEVVLLMKWLLIV